MLNGFLKKIPAYIILLIRLVTLNMVLFSVFRLLFYIANRGDDVSGVALPEILQAFRRGLEFDIAVICWVLYIPLFLFFFARFFRRNSGFYLAGHYTFIFLMCIYYLVYSADIPYFEQFGSHLSRNAFLWKEHPGFIAGMIFGSFRWWGYLLLFGVFVFVLIWLSGKLFRKFLREINDQPPRGIAIEITAFVFSAALVTTGARGRITDNSGLQEGLAIVSGNPFINQVAINPNFKLWRSVILENDAQKYQTPPDIHDKIAFTRKYLGITEPFDAGVSRTISNPPGSNCNFVIVIMESMSVYKMGFYRGKNLTPHFNALVKESVFFSNFFSSGIHTFNGIFSTISGYPSIWAEQPMKQYTRRAFRGIGALLKERGYETHYYCTHDPHFDNAQGFLTLNHFDRVTSEYDFPYGERESSMGVPDHILFDRLIETMNSRTGNLPVVSVLMTASDHGPWKIPSDIPFKPNGANEKENCTLYADWAIGHLMERARKCAWYPNTVFIFVGDHGLSMGHTYEMPLSYNHVPLVIHQPAIFSADTISTPGYQPDIPATIMGIAGGTYVNNTFGIDLLKERHPFVVFSADDKIGCVNDGGFFYYRTTSNGNTYLRKYPQLDPVNYKDRYKELADSMDWQMKDIYETARYLIERDYRDK